MLNQQLVEYIDKARQSNISDDSIRQSLISSGWQETIISEHLKKEVTRVSRKGGHLSFKVAIWIVSTVVVGLVVIGTLFFVYPSPIFFTLTKLKLSQGKYPILYKAPISHTLSTSSALPDNSYTYYGITFSSPWGIYTAKKESEGAASLTFKNDRKIIVFDPPKDLHLVQAMTKDMSSREIESLEKSFGKQALASNYAMQHTILFSDARNMKLLMPKEKSVGSFVLLTLKAIMALYGSDANPEIIAFETADIKGFQYSKANDEVKRLS